MEEYVMSNKVLLAYFGHHKCASTWIHGILTEVCKELSLKIEYVHSHKQFDSDLESFVERNNIDFLTYANADIDFVEKIENLKGFHVIRDPRDIAVSSYFSHLYSHPTDGWKELARHRERLQTVSQEEGLILDSEFISLNFKRLYDWNYAMPNVLELKLEEIIGDPRGKFVEIFAHLGIFDEKISLERLSEILEQKSFSRLAGGRKPGDEDIHSHFRKGIPGDWVNHFNEDHKKYFKEKYNQLLIKLGYEKGTDW